MNTSPAPSWDPIGHSVAAESNGNGRPRAASSPHHYLHTLPGSVLLDRLPMPMLATKLDGGVVYNNPAFAAALGFRRSVTLIGHQLPALLDGHSATPPRDCVTTLRAAGNAVVDWRHTEGFPVHTVIFETLLFRTTEEILLIGVTDVTELVWATRHEPL